MYSELMRSSFLFACISLFFSNLNSMELQIHDVIPKELRLCGKIADSVAPDSFIIGHGEGNDDSWFRPKYQIDGSSVYYVESMQEEKFYIRCMRLGNISHDDNKKFAVQVQCRIFNENVEIKDVEKILYQRLISAGILKEGSEDIGNARKDARPALWSAYIDGSCFKNTISSNKEDEFYLDHAIHDCVNYDPRLVFQCLSLVSPKEESIANFLVEFLKLDLVAHFDTNWLMRSKSMKTKIKGQETSSGIEYVLTCRDPK